ncbi:MAG: MOSC N-terminal beta barrel domain-containing protein [Gammaproteobacteria bacterium]
MSIVGHVRELWRYPVKSMQGGRLREATVTPQGIVGDRGWAMRDEQRREVQWGKMYPQLMLCVARYREEPAPGVATPVDITFPDGTTLGSDDPGVHAKLTALCGRAASLWPLQPATDRDFYKRYKPDEQQWLVEIADAFAREPGEPLPDFAQFPAVLLDYVAVPGTFFDNEEIHLLTTATLAAMQAANPAARWDVRRFRPNFFIETVPGLDGQIEQGWIGRTLAVGEAELRISAPTPRCGMTTRPQADLPFDKTILRTIVKEGAQNLGVGAHVVRAGRVRAGDVVHLRD